MVNRLPTSIVAAICFFPYCITSLSPPEQCPLEPSCCEEDCCGQGTSWDPPFCRLDPGASGFNGTYSDTFDTGCVERNCCENACCSPGTWYDARLASCVPSSSFECIPTSGQCASTFSELEQALAGASANDIVAICGNDIPIQTEYALLVPVNKPNLSLCCLGPGQCIIMSNGNDRNLEVLGTDFTAQGIDFVDGTDVLGDGGGNVIIDAVGNHEIVDCSFRNGASSDGGNLAVRKADNFFLAKSSFINGATSGLGGGVDVDVLGSFKVEGCSFENNRANSGGGFHVRNAQEISVKNSHFNSNEAKFGGGFFASGLNEIRSLEVLSCTFDGNVANTSGGGAGKANLPSVEQFAINLSGNSGSGNIGTDECDGFVFNYYGYPDSADVSACIGVDQDITDLPL